jgi:pyruvate kinase
MTFSGYTAYKISSFRPKAPIYIFTGNTRLINTLNLVWGVRAFYYKNFESTDQSIQDVNNVLKEQGLISAGDLVINTASLPIKNRPRTNAVKISEIE